jgi:hypothetical protein
VARCLAAAEKSIARQVYGILFCNPKVSIGACTWKDATSTADATGVRGCKWVATGTGPKCQLDSAKTDYSLKFAGIMCLGDGTGPLLNGTALKARGDDLAYFHAKVTARPARARARTHRSRKQIRKDGGGGERCN